MFSRRIQYRTASIPLDGRLVAAKLLKEISGMSVTTTESQAK
jgi:hypothetical protein